MAPSGESSIGGFAYSQNGGGILGSLSNLEKQILGGELSAQGSAALVYCAVIIAVVVFSPGIAARMGYPPLSIVAGISLILSSAFTVYFINCMAVGGCKTLSWLMVAAIGVSILLFWIFLRFVAALFDHIMRKVARDPFAQDVDERTADYTDSRLKPDVVMDAPGLAPPMYAGQPMPGSPGDMAATSNALIIDQAKENLYEGYDAEGNEQGAPRPYVEGEMASASA